MPRKSHDVFANSPKSSEGASRKRAGKHELREFRERRKMANKSAAGEQEAQSGLALFQNVVISLLVFMGSLVLLYWWLSSMIENEKEKQ